MHQNGPRAVEYGVFKGAFRGLSAKKTTGTAVGFEARLSGDCRGTGF